MENAVKQVFESPRLYKQLNDLLEHERSRRLHFQQHLNNWEGQKVKFIKGEVITSSVIPGFRIPSQAIFNEQNNLDALRDLLS